MAAFLDQTVEWMDAENNIISECEHKFVEDFSMNDWFASFEVIFWCIDDEDSKNINMIGIAK